MTTIACNRQEMAADSAYTFDDIGLGTGQHNCRKLYRIGASIFGMRGEDCTGAAIALEWIKRGAKWKSRPVLPKQANFYFLELHPSGIFLWTHALDRDELIEPFMAIGSGAKAAMYCMKVLKMPPLKAVEEASKVDLFTKPPFYLEKIKAPRKKDA